MIYVFAQAVVDCGTLSDPTNGKVTTTGTKKDATAEYKCDSGYECSGCQTPRKCLSAGKWNGMAATCTRKYCIYTIRNLSQNKQFTSTEADVANWRKQLQFKFRLQKNYSSVSL